MVQHLDRPRFTTTIYYTDRSILQGEPKSSHIFMLLKYTWLAVEMGNTKQYLVDNHCKSRTKETNISKSFAYRAIK